MRTLSQIDESITAAARRLNELHAERAAWLQDRIAGICAAHDAGRSNLEIATERGMTVAAVNGLLWRAGRTCSGRTAIKRRLRSGFVDQVAVP